MSGKKDVPMEIDLNEDEIIILEKMAKSRGIDLDEFLNQILSKHSQY